MNQLNEYGIREGYWEINGSSTYKGYYVNGKQVGYWEFYFTNGKIYSNGHYVNGEEKGLWLFYLQNKTYKRKTFHL